jgi:hypothetical protein
MDSGDYVTIEALTHHANGPVYLRGAEPGDIRIIDVRPRPCVNPTYSGKSFGSNAAAWWGYHYNDLLTEPKPREVVTIYEIDATAACSRMCTCRSVRISA